MQARELSHILIAILLFALVISYENLLLQDYFFLLTALLYAAIIILVNVVGKKIGANAVDAEAESSIWFMSRYGLTLSSHWKKPIPMGVILPMLGTIFSLGMLKMATFLTYEATALKRRSAKRFGTFSYTAITDNHNALIGASGIVAVLALSFISYWLPIFEGLPKYAAYYAFWNMLPFSKLDGAQIFFGSRVIWYSLALITAIFTTYALLLV